MISKVVLLMQAINHQKRYVIYNIVTAVNANADESSVTLAKKVTF